MKTRYIIASLCVAGFTAGAALIDNDFSTGDGTYDGTAGASLGVAAELGNASGANVNIVVGSGIASSKDPVIRSRATSSVTTHTDFSVSFVYGAVGSNASFVNAGWSLAAGTDGSNNYASERDFRFVVSLGKTALNDVTFSYASSISTAEAFSGTPTMTLIDGLTYTLSFGLIYNGTTDKNWTVDSMDLSTGGSSLGSMSGSYTVDHSDSWNAREFDVEGQQDAYAYFGGNRDRGFDGFDAVSAAIPEPATIGMLGLGALVAIIARRMRS